MSVLGVGTVLFAWIFCYGMVMVYVSHNVPRGFFFDFLPQYATFAFGDILLFVGSVIFVRSITTLKEAHQKGSLVVKGVYSCMRHPMYAAWIFFIIPGIAIIARSLLFLSVALFAYCAYKRLIKKEEDVLVRQFGQGYIDYKNRVGLLF